MSRVHGAQPGPPVMRGWAQGLPGSYEHGDMTLSIGAPDKLLLSSNQTPNPEQERTPHECGEGGKGSVTFVTCQQLNGSPHQSSPD